MKTPWIVVSVIGAGLLFTATAYADPYNPAERAIGGGLLGAGTGAVIGAIAGGGHGAGGGAALQQPRRHLPPAIPATSSTGPIESGGVPGGRSAATVCASGWRRPVQR